MPLRTVARRTYSPLRAQRAEAGKRRARMELALFENARPRGKGDRSAVLKGALPYMRLTSTFWGTGGTRINASPLLILYNLVMAAKIPDMSNDLVRRWIHSNFYF